MKNDYIKNIQGLRFVFFVMIFMTHCSFISETVYERWWGPIVVAGGPEGVSFFIFCCGFFLYRKYRFSCDYYSIKSNIVYSIKKMQSFYPYHILTLIIMIPLAYYNSPDIGWLIKRGVANLFLVHSFIPDTSYYFSFNAVSWYLSASLWFYFIGPWLVTLAKRLTNVWGVYMFVVVLQILLALLLRDSKYMHAIIYINPIVRSFDLFLGILCAKVHYEHNIYIKCDDTLIEICLCIFLIITHVVYHYIDACFQYSILYIPVMTYIFVAFPNRNGKISQVLSGRICVYLGDISFFLYIVHKPIIRYLVVLSHHVYLNPFIYVGISFVITLICGFCLYNIRRMNEYGFCNCVFKR